MNVVGPTAMRHVAGVVSHVPGTSAEMVLADGSHRRLAARPSSDELPVAPFRRLVAQVLERGEHLYLPGLRRLLSAPPELVVVRGDPPGTTQVSAKRWRVDCRCGTTELLLTEATPDRATEWGERILGSAVRSPGRYLSVRPDPALGLSVVACRWPGGRGPADLPEFAAALTGLADDLRATPHRAG